LVANDDAPVVGVMTDLYATGEYGYRQLAEELNRQGYRFRDRYGRKPFSKWSVRSVLENVWLYAGRLPVGRERDYGYSQLYDGAHEALITTEVAERVLGARRVRTLRQDKGVSRVYLLTGIAYCHECGGRLWGMARRGRGSYCYYHAEGSCRSRKGTWGAEEAETEVLGLLDGLVLPAEVERMVQQSVRERALAEPSNADLVESIERERRKLGRLTEMRLEGEIDREEYYSRKEDISAVISGLEARVGGARYDASAALSRLADVGEVVRSGQPAEQKRVLQSVFERVEFSVDTRTLARVPPRPWFGMLFQDVSAWYAECAWRGPGADSVPRLAALIG
jgi:hypothetical protein